MSVSMEASKFNNSTRMLNPWVLHVQKLGLELKCSLCLDFYALPMLLPCNHIFCHECLQESSQFAVPCSLCQAQYTCGDIRPAPFMENLVSIYRSLDATFYANHPHNVRSDVGRVLKQCAVASVNKATKETAHTGQEVIGNGQVKESGKFSREMKSFSGFEKSNQSTLGFSLENAEVLDGRIVEMDMNHIENSLPRSPPSGVSSEANNDHTPSNCSSKRLAKEVCDSISVKSFPGSTFEIEGSMRDFKRQKKMPDASPSQMFMETNFECRSIRESKKELNPSATVLDENCLSNFTCGFCLSSTVYEATGEMLHYVNGNPVEDDNAANSDVVHVHRKCIEWAPQVYFVGETVKNLDKEMARGAKLKCTRCGLKGAALGCYAKSCRRTYHALCAAEVSNCRWDCDNYLMLCPTHASLRFPNEKPNHSTKLPSARNRTSKKEQSLSWHASSARAKEWVLCGSALSADDKFLLVKFAKKIGATVSKMWTPDVTHVVAATDDEGACTRTFKVLMAILLGRWVLKIDWIKACMKAMQRVDEEPYEVSLDNQGCCNGSKLGRLRVSNNDVKLFKGLKFYFVGDFAPSFAKDLEELILAAGGDVLESKESLMQERARDDPKSSATSLIIYNPEPPEGCQLGEEVSMYWQKLNEAEELAASSGSEIINHTWVLESIAACKLQPLINLTSHIEA